jgi:YD repeat-containing protein
MNGEPRLVGSWRRSGGEACAARYPVTLRIDASGLYVGAPEQAGEFTWWDAGTWRVKDPGRIALSTANDAVITYEYTLAGDVLKVTDAEGCTVAYRREV